MNKPKYSTVIIGQITYDDIVTYDQPVIQDSPGGDGLYSLSGAFMVGTEPLGLVVRKGYDCDINEIGRVTGSRVNYDGVVDVPNQPNIHIWNMFDRAGHRYFVNQRWSGSDDFMAPIPSDIPLSYMENTKSIHIAAFPFPWSKQVIEYMKEAGPSVMVQVDPHFNHVYKENYDVWENLLKHVNIFLPSEEEIIRLFGIKKQEDVMCYLPYMKTITSMGPHICGIKLGGRGAIVYDQANNQCWFMPTYDDVDVVDVTGCGDVFCGAFLNKYTEKHDTFDALLAATIAASFNLEHYGVMENFLVTQEMFVERTNKFSALSRKEKCLMT